MKTLPKAGFFCCKLFQDELGGAMWNTRNSQKN